MSDAVTFALDEGVGLITLNRPDQLNTVNGELLEGVGHALQQADAEDAVRVVVITGAGRAFCAGADLAADSFAAPDPDSFSSCALPIQPWELRKPVIAAVNGHALGIGLGIAMQCDIRVMALEGKYGFMQNRLGVVADCGIEKVLPQIIGFERAFEMIVGGARIDGERAAQWQLASRVVPAAEVLDTALTLARDWAVHCSPLTMGLHKQLLWKGLGMDLATLVKLETRALLHTMGEADAAEGGMAFFEKRPPRWTSSVSRQWPDFMEQD